MKAAACHPPDFISSPRISAVLDWPARTGLALLHALIAAPLPLFLLALAAMLFRPPDLDFYSVDRIAFGLLVLAVGLRTLVLRQKIQFHPGLLLPMLGLSGWALLGLIGHSFDATAWSVLAARFFVPAAMFLIAQLVFRDTRSLLWLERFLLLVFIYLTVIAVAFLLGADALIFPRFILDESIGIHADRARGPFLQAAANGLSLNLLGLIALDAFRRRCLHQVWGLILLACFPVAIAATKTRAVWIAFSASMLWMAVRAQNRRFRIAGVAVVLVMVAGALAVLYLGGTGGDLADRANDDSSVKFRFAAYQAAWEMFRQKPLAGWGTIQVQAELAGQIRNFRGEEFAVHNTYLQILVEQGLVGFLLYGWLLRDMFRLGKVELGDRDDLARSLHSLWPILLAVYLFNAISAVMTYQFVNSLLFTFAGVLAVSAKAREAGVE